MSCSTSSSIHVENGPCPSKKCHTQKTSTLNTPPRVEFWCFNELFGYLHCHWRQEAWFTFGFVLLHKHVEILLVTFRATISARFKVLNQEMSLKFEYSKIQKTYRTICRVFLFPWICFSYSSLRKIWHANPIYSTNFA